MTVKLLTEQHLEFLSLTGGCTGSSESTFVKMPHCWKSHVAAHIRNSLFGLCCILSFRGFYFSEAWQHKTESQRGLICDRVIFLF